MEDKNPKILHGNRAKVDPKKHQESYFAGSMVIMQNTNDDKTESEREDSVKYSKNYVEENKK